MDITDIKKGHYRQRESRYPALIAARIPDALKSQGKGYQSRINAILRREMLAQVQSKAR